MRVRGTGGLPWAALCLAMLVPSASAAQRGPGGAGSPQAVLSASPASPALHVIPFPGTPDASAQSQIIFSALRPSDFAGDPVVTGSSSRSHLGRLVSLPDHAGTEFALTAPFTAGEKVTVRALLRSPRAGTESGDRGSMSLTYSFTVASPAPSTSTTASAARRSERASSRVHAVFRSDPALEPPPVYLSSGAAPGIKDMFLAPRSQVLFVRAPKQSKSQSGPMILSPKGQLLWFDPLGGNWVAFNLEVQRYQGRPVLTWWQGGAGEPEEDVIMNASYQALAVLKAGWGYGADLHEFQITPQGTALIDSVVPVRANLTSIGGPANGAVFDYVIQELDIRTGQVLWEWHALGHVPVSASYWPRYGAGAYDAYHLNSIQQLPGHKLLVSIRSTSSVYEIDERTGRVIWTLGGRRSSFRMGPGTRFEWQHDAHLNGHGVLTVFDDAWAAGVRQTKSQSAAKELKIDFAKHTVSLIRADRHSPPLLAGAEGSMQLLPNHDAFVGWGSEPDFSQYSSSGRQIFNASFPLGVVSYRAYRFAWTGHPLTPPALADSKGKRGVVWLYASWNGATQVASWRVLAGLSPQHLKRLEVKPWTGFQTTIRMPSRARYFAVQALDGRGQVLRRSAVVAAPA
jgi:hypothetical protein